MRTIASVGFVGFIRLKCSPTVSHPLASAQAVDSSFVIGRSSVGSQGLPRDCTSYVTTNPATAWQALDPTFRGKHDADLHVGRGNAGFAGGSPILDRAERDRARTRASVEGRKRLVRRD